MEEAGVEAATRFRVCLVQLLEPTSAVEKQNVNQTGKFP
jgi:hypothetical protein